MYIAWCNFAMTMASRRWLHSMLTAYVFTYFISSRVCAGMTEQEATKLLDGVLGDMDPRLRPNSSGSAVQVKVNIFIISFGSISENNMDYSLNIYLRQSWADSRLNHTGFKKPVTLSSHATHHIWIPDLFFRNEKKASFHDVTAPNKLIKIYPDGTVLYSTKLSLILSCHMQLWDFPMDEQECSMEIASYAYTADNLYFTWRDKPVEMNEDLELPRFNLKGITTYDCTKKFSVTGVFSCIAVSFNLQRDMGFYLLDLYVPSIFIILISWLSFWINTDAVPARVTLGVTTVLTMTHFASSRLSVPSVSYPKASDCWLAVCMFFVFSTLVEYAIVNALSRSSSYQNTNTSKTRLLGGKTEVYAQCSAGTFKNGSHIVTRMRKTSNSPDSSCEDISQPYMEPKHTCCCSTENKGLAVDRICRLLFPLGFILFNIIYWMTYLSRRYRKY